MNGKLDPSKLYHFKLGVASFSYISDRERFVMLLLIYDKGPIPSSEIEKMMGYDKSVIKHQLDVLKNTKTVSLDESGKWIPEDMPLIEETGNNVYRTTKYGNDAVEIIVGVDKEKIRKLSEKKVH